MSIARTRWIINPAMAFVLLSNLSASSAELPSQKTTNPPKKLTNEKHGKLPAKSLPDRKRLLRHRCGPRWKTTRKCCRSSRITSPMPIRPVSSSRVPSFKTGTYPARRHRLTFLTPPAFFFKWPIDRIGLSDRRHNIDFTGKVRWNILDTETPISPLKERGFFQVKCDTGETSYYLSRREPRFALNASAASNSRRLYRKAARLLEPEITISTDATKVAIGSDGKVNA